MARVFFTADHHFGHSGILDPSKHCNRGDHFSSIEEHDRVLAEMWNAVVSPRDTVWHVGDFSYKASFEHAERIFKKLNGTKHLILGNHDKVSSRLPWASQQLMAQISVPVAGHPKNKHVILCHYAMRTWPRRHGGSLMLFGHSHGAMAGCSQSMDVGVDVWGFRPVTLEEIMVEMAKLKSAKAEDWEQDEEDQPTATEAA
jgi:calcineurin-like phosphoesterase family protein